MADGGVDNLQQRRVPGSPEQPNVVERAPLLGSRASALLGVLLSAEAPTSPPWTSRPRRPRQAFRDELRAWLARQPPRRGPARARTTALRVRRDWQRKLHEAGWAGVSWPKEYGGRGATLIEQAIFGEELARARRPLPANVLGLVMGGPVVIAHGTDEQKERFLEPILSGEEIWCQGFSEPESGSDLASLKTRAVKRTASGWSPARRSGPPTPTRPSGACSSRAPTPTRRSTRASPTSSWTWSRRRSRCGRCARSPARRSSTSSSSRRRASPTRTSSAASATAGRSRSRR